MLPPPGYRSLRLIGTGATSRVFAAEHIASGSTVALKRLHRHLLRSDDALARLRRELEALGRLRHRSIVAARDVMRWGGDPTVVLDYIEGVGLEEVIEQDGLLDIELTERIARQVLDALSAAHAVGIVHRDIKPQNLRLSPEQQVYLLDFGSARLDAHSELTHQGTSVGTPDYMPPELFRGPAYDPRVDLYGLGATLFQCLTGRAPHVADSLTELAYKRSHEPVVPVRRLRPDIPAGLAQLVDRCLARSPDDRFATASLATFALDHPEVELGFRRRRAEHPPCLHCGELIPAVCSVCAACGSDHPFSYATGRHHVALHGVRSAAAFVDAIVRRFPERAHPDHVEHLAERVAALDDQSQRVLSFVSEAEAVRLADALQDSGAQVEVTSDPGLAGLAQYTIGSFAAAVAFFFVLQALGMSAPFGATLLLVLPALMFTGLERLMSVGRAEQGILSSGRYPAAVAPRLRGGLTASALALVAAGSIAPWIAAAGLAGISAAAAALTTPLLVGAASAAAAAAVAWWASFGGAAGWMSASPEPSAIEKLRSALSTDKNAMKGRLQRQLSFIVGFGVLALIPLELGALSAMSAMAPAVVASAGLATPTPVPAEAVAWAPSVVPGGQSMAPAAPNTAPTAPTTADLWPVPAPPSVVQSETPAGARPGWADGVSLGFVALSAILAGWLIRRRRALQLGARGLLDEFEKLPTPERRPLPNRSTASLQPADSLALTAASDPFVLGARQRLTDLAHCLDETATERMGRALAALASASPKESVLASARARAIVETDPELELRFELLHLEGEMEKQAARLWYEGLKADDDAS